MEVEVGIKALLLQSTEIASAVEDRIYNGAAPEGSTWPAITFFITYERPIQHSLGLSASYEATVEIGVWSPSYGVSRTLGRAIRAATVGRSFRSADNTLHIQAFTENDTSLYPAESDSELSLCEVNLNFMYSTYKD